MPQPLHYAIERALAIALGLFLLVAAFRGGNIDEVVVASLYGALLITGLALAVRWSGRGTTPSVSSAAIVFWAALGLLTLVTLVGLIPLAPDTWLALRGRTYYEPVIAALRTMSPAEASLPLSLDPPATRRSLLLVVTCLAIAYASACLGRRSMLQLLGAFAIVATAEALIGLVQLGYAGALTFSYSGHNRATGTFVNKNHFATMLAMALPLLLLRATGQFTFFVPHMESGPMGRAWWGAASAVVVAGLIASTSRAGLIAAGVSSTLACYFIWRRKRTVSRPAMIVGIALAVFALAVSWLTGIRRLIESVVGSGAADGFASRAQMNGQTWDGIVSLFPFGSGIGSYAIVFPRFQTPPLTGFVEYAHNDYLQLLFEGGAGGLIVLVLLAAAAWFAVKLTIHLGDREARIAPGAGCLLGALAFAIHAGFDFPAHIPALAILATMLFAAAINPAIAAAGQRRKPPVGTLVPWAPSVADIEPRFVR